MRRVNIFLPVGIDREITHISGAQNIHFWSNTEPVYSKLNTNLKKMLREMIVYIYTHALVLKVKMVQMKHRRC